VRRSILSGAALAAVLGVLAPATPAASAASAGAAPRAAVRTGVPAQATTPPVPVPGVPASIQFVGKGWGHGRGLGQWGALGYAVEHDWGYERILDHFYGGTDAATRPDPGVRVRLVAWDDKPVVVHRPAGGVTVRVAGLAEQTWPAVQVTPNPDRSTFTLAASTDCAGTSGWTPITPGALAVELVAPGADDAEDPSQLLSVCQPDGTLRAYRGTLEARRGTEGEARLVNATTMERYLRGVVPRESPASWADLGGGRGREALRAQAVAARSYAFTEHRYSYAGTCDTTACQVYSGAAVGVPGDWQRLEDPRTDAAIAATAGEVRVRAGQVQSTEFSSSTGGWTAGGTFPVVQDVGDAISLNPNANWSIVVPTATIEAAYPQIGAFRTITVTRRNGVGAFGGRALSVQVQGSAGHVTISGNEARSRFSLKSDWFRVATGFLSSPAAAVAQGRGSAYWVAGRNGSVLNMDGAGYFGSLDDRRLAAPIVAMAGTPQGDGYWLLGADGGVFSFGAAPFFGSTGDIRLNRPVVGLTPRPQGDGYWFVGTDGGVFTFGAAEFFGSTGGIRLNQPIIGMAATSTGRGYWLVARDGGVFAFGDAAFHGSTGGIVLNAPIVGMAVRPQGDGYWFVAADGGVFTFGGAPFLGSLGGQAVPSPIVGMSVTASGQGYRLVLADGTTYGFGDAA